MSKKTIEKAKELVKRDNKELTKLHIVDWMLYLEKAAIVVEKEQVYDNFKMYGEK